MLNYIKDLFCLSCSLASQSTAMAMTGRCRHLSDLYPKPKNVYVYNVLRDHGAYYLMVTVVQYTV